MVARLPSCMQGAVTKPAVGALAWMRSESPQPGELDLQVIATHLADPKASPTGALVVLGAAVTVPYSAGSVSLLDRDTRIRSNFLDDARDQSRMMEAVELARRIARTEPLCDLIDSELTSGDPFATLRSYHHGCAPVPMGEVVDTQGRVFSIEGLRVVDASILPSIPSAPPHLLVLIVAEEIAWRIVS